MAAAGAHGGRSASREYRAGAVRPGLTSAGKGRRPGDPVAVARPCRLVPTDVRDRIVRDLRGNHLSPLTRSGRSRGDKTLGAVVVLQAIPLWATGILARTGLKCMASGNLCGADEASCCICC